MKRITTGMAGVLLWAGLAAAAQRTTGPDYSSRVNIYNTTDVSPFPYASFINRDALRAYQSCIKKKTSRSTPNCTDYEYFAPYSLDTETIRVGHDLRAAWQRLEDRYYWRAMVELNNPSMYLTNCLVDLHTSLRTDSPKVVINVDTGMAPASVPLPTTAPDDRLRLDSYLPLPQVSNTDYCQGLEMNADVLDAAMYLPGICLWVGPAPFCMTGSEPSLNPAAYPPIRFNRSLALKRVLNATKRAEGEYQREYLADVGKALSPTETFFPLVWDTPLSSVVAPTAKLIPDLTGLMKKAKAAGEALGGVYKGPEPENIGTAAAYYAQGLGGFMGPLSLHLLPGSADVVNQPPGIWKLEEFKRTFPLNNPLLYQQFGYVSLFNAWTSPTATLLPEDAGAKPLRPLIYFATSLDFYLPDPIPVIKPAPMLIYELGAGLPYAGMQAHFTWTSVAEGYPVARVQGTPPADYKALIKAALDAARVKK